MFVIFISTVATFLCIILYWFLSYRRRFSSLNKIPGPTGLPILGCVLELGSTPADRLKYLIKVNKTYGHQAKAWFGPTNMFLMSSDLELNECILSSPKYTRKSPEYDLARPWLANGIFTSFGNYWQKRRKIISPALHFKNLDGFLGVFNNQANTLIKRLADIEGKGKCDISPYITACSLDIICETAMGVSVKAQESFDNEYVNAIDTVLRIIYERIYSLWKRSDFLFLFSSDYRKQNKALKIINGFIKTVIEERRQKLLNMNSSLVNEKDDGTGIKNKLVFLDILLKASIDGKALSDEDIRGEVNTFMVAGLDTTASTLGFVIYEIARNPDVQNYLFTEVQEIYGNDKNYEPTMQDLNEMKYTELVIKETLRLYPSGPHIARLLEEDLHYKGTTYPKGLQIIIFIYQMHRRPDLFPEPDKFKPHRFLDKDNPINPLAYIPFSSGPRNCIGQKYAMYELKCIISKIIMNFELVHSDDITLIAAPVLQAENGINVLFKNREL